LPDSLLHYTGEHMPNITGCIEIVDANGQTVNVVNRNGVYPPFRIKLGNGITATASENGSVVDVELSSTVTGYSQVLVQVDGTEVSTHSIIDIRGPMKPEVTDYPESIVLDFEPAPVRSGSTVYHPEEIELSGTGVSVAAKTGGINVTINRLAVQNEGSAVTSRPAINFIGDGVTVADDPGGNRSNVTITSASEILHCDYVLEYPVNHTCVDFNEVNADGHTPEVGMKLLLTHQFPESGNGPYIVSTYDDETGIAVLAPLWNGTIPCYSQIRLFRGDKWIDSFWATHVPGTFWTDNLMIVPTEYTISNVLLTAGTVQIENVYALDNQTQANVVKVRPSGATNTRAWQVTHVHNDYGQLCRAHIVVEAQDASGTLNTADTSRVDVHIINRRGVWTQPV
jgi:hypothetical protein